MPFQPISKQQQDQMQNQAVNVSGGAGASFADVVPGQEKGQKSSGQYANLQQYIQANQPQAAQMGQKLVGSVEKAGQEATQKVEQFAQQKPSVQAFDPNAYIQRAPELSQEEKATYQQTKQTGGYTGPQQLEQAQGYSEAQKAAQVATDKAKLAGTESGQQKLLKETFARPTYSTGQVNLDQVLLGGNQQAKQSLSDLSKRYSDLYNVFNQKAEDVGAGINQANQQALANRQSFLQAEEQAKQALINPIAQRAQQLNIENPALVNRVMSDINDTKLTRDTLERLGLNAGTRLFDLNLASYLQPNLQQVGLNEAATGEERNKYQALANLFGDQSMKQIQAQGQQINPLGFNKQQFEQDLFNRLSDFNSDARTRMLNTSKRVLTDGGFVDVGGGASVLDILEANPNIDWLGGNVNAMDLMYPNLQVTREYGQDENGVPISSKMLLPGQTAPDEINPYEMEAFTQAKADLFGQLLDYLNQQNYTRGIGEEV